MPLRKTFCAVLLLVSLGGGAAHAMSSTNYGISWDSVNSGGDDVSSSTNYWVRDTLGEQAIGISSSTNYEIRAGYRTADLEKSVLVFDIGTQANASQIDYSAFDYAGNGVTVSSASGFSVGDFIAVAENKGFSQLVAIGKIESIAANVITVDEWEGDGATMSATPAGGDDYVFALTGDAAALGTLASGTPSVSITHTTVFSNVENGYTVSVHSDGGLRDGSSVIDAVSDGAVSLGSEEYGAEVVGSKADGAGTDFAISTTQRDIQVSDTLADDERVAVIYKASITSATDGGSYSQLVTYILTPNF